jgi:hypothetical protein
MATNKKTKFGVRGPASATERPCRSGVGAAALPQATATAGKTMSKGDYIDTLKDCKTALRQSVSNTGKRTNGTKAHVPVSDVYSETHALPNAYPSLQDTPQEDGSDSYVSRTT